MSDFHENIRLINKIGTTTITLFSEDGSIRVGGDPGFFVAQGAGLGLGAVNSPGSFVVKNSNGVNTYATSVRCVSGQFIDSHCTSSDVGDYCGSSNGCW